MIQCFGSYSRRVTRPPSSSMACIGAGAHEPRTKDTHNILLEYGTYDLRMIFGHRLPPVIPKGIITFWAALFEVADAVHGIHEFKIGSDEYHGYINRHEYLDFD